MAIASIFQISLAIAFAANAANNEIGPLPLRADYDKPVSIACTEVALEFSVGGTSRSTVSKDCTKKPQSSATDRSIQK